MVAALSLVKSGVGDNALGRALDHTMDLTLNEQGMICDCNMDGMEALGYRRSDLAWQHISALVPELAGIKLMLGEKINPRLHFLSRIGYRFRLIGQGGKHMEGELFIRDMEQPGKRFLRAMIFPVMGGSEAGLMHGF